MRPAVGALAVVTPGFPRKLPAERILPGSLLAGALLLAAACGPPKKPLPAGVEVVVRGHQELVLAERGEAVPLFLGREPVVGLCLQAPATIDVSQWRARLSLGRRFLQDEPAEPRAAMGPTVCFGAEVPAELVTAAEHTLSGELTDAFDGRRFRLPRLAVRLQPDDALYRRIENDAVPLMRAAGGGGATGDLMADLDAIALRAQQEGFPQRAVRFQLTAVYLLRQRGTAEALAEAQRRLDALPPWLTQSAAAGWGAQAALAQATLALQDGRLRTAWESLRQAEARQLRTANFNHLVTVKSQARILAQAGSLEEARGRLQEALDGCRRGPCNEKLLPELQIDLAWMTALDPLAAAAELDQAEEALSRAEPAFRQEDKPLEEANWHLNEAALKLRRGEDPLPALKRARGLLAGKGTEQGEQSSGRAQELAGWADILEGEWSLAAGDPAAAVERCGRLARAPATVQLEAWAWGCIGRAEGRRGRWDLAAEALQQALLLHEREAAEPLGQRTPLGPGRKAEDSYEAARAQVELGDPAAAWDLLALLDRVSRRAADKERCRGGTAAAAAGDRQERDRQERDRLLRQLEALDAPASRARRQQRAPVQRSLRQRLQELWRLQELCEPPTAATDEGLHLRAVALADEVLLLHRLGPGGSVRALRRPVPRETLLETLAAIAGMLEGRQADGAEWARRTAPLAAALLPAELFSPSVELPETTVFALYGILQGAPLGALPLLAENEALRLIDVTVPAIRPAGAAPGRPDREGHAVIVRDPRGDLGSRPVLDLPTASLPWPTTVLTGAEATAAALFEALKGAALLHVDAHGLFDAAFPEVSSLTMADRPVTFVELAGLPNPLWLANLSGCQTGRWPVSAGSGRYGIGGLLTERGTRWVIASRADLGNELAAELNRIFYDRLARGEAVPEAYGAALREIQGRFPAAAWGAYLLLSSAEGGQAAGAVTPLQPRTMTEEP